MKRAVVNVMYVICVTTSEFLNPCSYEKLALSSVQRRHRTTLGAAAFSSDAFGGAGTCASFDPQFGCVLTET